MGVSARPGNAGIKLSGGQIEAPNTWMPGPALGLFFHLYLIADTFSRKIVDWEVHAREGAELAAVLIRQAALAEGCTLRPLVLHAGNGSPMNGATMKTTMEKLGIMASCIRKRVSDDNPFSEAPLRTCKYRPDLPVKGFATRTDAQARVKSSASWYNGEHRHSAICFVTPSARHNGRDHQTLASRASLYANARAAKSATMVRQNPKLATRRTRLAQSRNPDRCS